MSLITPHTRGQIVRALQACGKWSGSRAGVQLAFTLAAGKQNRVRFWVSGKSFGQIDGRADTVFQAAEEIETRIKK